MYKMKKSFTLVELLIVLVIVGVLAAIAIPQYSIMVEKARWAQAAQTLWQIFRAEQAYRAETGEWFWFLADAGYNHDPTPLGIKLMDISHAGQWWGDKYLHYECFSDWGSPAYDSPDGDDVNTLASPNENWTPKLWTNMILDFSENKLRVRKPDGTWVNYQ